MAIPSSELMSRWLTTNSNTLDQEHLRNLIRTQSEQMFRDRYLYNIRNTTTDRNINSNINYERYYERYYERAAQIAEFRPTQLFIDDIESSNQKIEKTNKGNSSMYKYKLSHRHTIDEYVNLYRRTRLTREILEIIYHKPYIYEVSTTLSNMNVRITVNFEYNENIFTFDVYRHHLELAETPIPENNIWSSNRTRTLRFDDSYLIEQVRTRYAFFDRPTSGLSNIVIDNYAPKLMYKSRFDQAQIPTIARLPKTIYAISPWFAQFFGAQQVPAEQLCRILGFDAKTLKTLITKIKQKEYSITFVGYGGTNVNTIYWLTEIMKFTQSVNLFNHMEIYEPDTVEISNLLRFPKNPYMESNVARSYGYVRTTSKMNLLEPAEASLLSRLKPELKPERIDGTRLPRRSKGTVYDNILGKVVPRDNHIYYGAPNINTRVSFNNVGHFISATHHGNSAHLWLNPTQDSDLQVESYGLIQLTPFFMNQLRLAIGLLETLASDSFDPKAKDQLLGEYSFDGISKLQTNKTYNFQLGSHNGLVATEDQAETAW